MLSTDGLIGEREPSFFGYSFYYFSLSRYSFDFTRIIIALDDSVTSGI